MQNSTARNFGAIGPKESGREYTVNTVIPKGYRSALGLYDTQKAIGLTVPEKNPQARYRNEHVTLQEIMQANGAPRG